MIKMINIAMCPINASEKSFFILTIIIISVPFLLVPQLCNRVTLEIRLDSEIIIKKALMRSGNSELQSVFGKAQEFVLP